MVDVATGDEPLDSLVDFLLFKAFWAQLIAGPIIRLHELRGQIETPRTLDYADLGSGLSRIVSGLFLKMVLADNIAPIVDTVFAGKASPNALDSLIGIVGFGLQIYFDFSAYSSIAIGSARLFGYRFPENFNWPYVSASPQEFWTRWHMTLSSWIRDYVFAPLNFASRNRPWVGHVWLVLSMALCGLWHGAKWTFVAWGFWHGLLLVANRTILRRAFAPVPAKGAPLFRWRFLPAILFTAILVHFGWLLFRAQSLAQAADMVVSLATLRGGLRPSTIRENSVLIVGCIFVGLWLCQVLRDPVLRFAATPFGARVWSIAKPVLYTIAIIASIVFDQEAQVFVYFQF